MFFFAVSFEVHISDKYKHVHKRALAQRKIDLRRNVLFKNTQNATRRSTRSAGIPNMFLHSLAFSAVCFPPLLLKLCAVTGQRWKHIIKFLFHLSANPFSKDSSHSSNSTASLGRHRICIATWSQPTFIRKSGNFRSRNVINFVLI